MIRAAGVVLLGFALLPAVAGCRPAASPEQREMQELMALYRAYEPLAACLGSAVAADPAFSGQLPERVVNAGLAPELQRVRQRYLGKLTDVADQPPATQVAATRETLLALAAYGAGRDAAIDEPLAIQRRRLASAVETTLLTARALDAPCEPSEELVALMAQAENPPN